MYYHKFKTVFCEILLIWDENGLTNLELLTWEWKRAEKPIINLKWLEENKVFFEDIEKQIIEYFNWKRSVFNVKINPKWTIFQQNVWKMLRKIPFWKINSYQDIAIKLWNPKASRAIWLANSKNPIPIIIPCHRVIWKNWKMTGFAHWIKIKEKLIDLEANSRI
jgi:methylated-DNA-[protein]-cysteine S-methyltransferase